MREYCSLGPMRRLGKARNGWRGREGEGGKGYDSLHLVHCVWSFSRSSSSIKML